MGQFPKQDMSLNGILAGNFHKHHLNYLVVNCTYMYKINSNDTPLQFWAKHLGLVQQKYTNEQQTLNNYTECTNLDRTLPALLRRSSRSSFLLRATAESSWISIPGLFPPIMASIAFWSLEMYWSSMWYWTISGTWLARRSEVIYKYIQSTFKYIVNHNKLN